MCAQDDVHSQYKDFQFGQRGDDCSRFKSLVVTLPRRINAALVES
jgi:hypothetical protein